MSSQRISNQLISQFQMDVTSTRTKHQIATQIIIKSENLIAFCVRRYLGWGVDKDELMHSGRIGLYEALVRFDVGKGTQLSTYAVPWIDECLRRAINENANIRLPKSALRVVKDCANLQAEQGPLSFQELGDQLGKDPQSIEEVIVGSQYRCIPLPSPDSKEEHLLSTESSTTLEILAVKQIIQDAMNDLPENWAITIWLRVVEEKSYAEIARITGHAIRTVRSWCSKALELLKHRVGEVLENIPF